MSRTDPVQAKLDIIERSRTSLLPWRGQFSPELVEHLIETFCPSAQTIADPFCGSGTVMVEAMRTGRAALGIDVNPAAYVLSSFSHFLGLSNAARSDLTRQAARLVTPHVNVDDGLFTSRSPTSASIASIVGSADDPMVRILLHVAALVGCGDSTDLSAWKLARGVQLVGRTMGRLEETAAKVEVVLGDARTELRGRACDAIVTSPPYINVFNYHQNYRPVMEHLGWSPLTCAVGEIGANRKHRQNRFLTVIQYCLDMAQLLAAAHEALTEDGVLVMVVGRESNVLRTAFYNGDLISRVVEETACFTIAARHERAFLNRFGATIHEDILVMKPRPAPYAEDSIIVVNAARQVAEKALGAALDRAPEAARPLIERALTDSPQVRASPHPEPLKSPLWPELLVSPCQ